MECNKEEAIRAKGIAENKMLNKDFVGARKIVLKAQQLYPDLDNVPQMLTVCDVHCSADVKVNGEMDWYGILQVAPAADEITIKKQYRRLAFLLHPDKNKFGGAEAAFKLVGEAHTTLTDRPKRVQHDMKRGASFRSVATWKPVPQANKASYTKKQPGVASSFANSTYTQPNGFNQQQQAPFTSNQTFWTICPSCGIRYQYYQTIMNKSLRCQGCKKPFVAHDLNAHTVPSAAPWNRPGIPQQEKRGPPAHFAGQQSNFGTGSNTGPQGNVDGGSAAPQPWSRSGFKMEFGGVSNNESKEEVKVDRDDGTANDVKFKKVKLHEINKKEQAGKSSAGNRNQKRGRKIAVESSESESSDSDVVVEDGRPSVQNTGTAGSNPRSSSRQKQSISYNEGKGGDDDFMTQKNKKSRMGGTSVNAEQSDPNFFGDANGVNGAAANAGATSKTNTSVDFSSEASPYPDSFTYPDPEFYDFDEERVERKFAVDQVWAIYDNLDAMPRYYALIRRVYGPKFKLRFNWLEYDPTGKAETLWYKGNLPIGSGSFKLGKAELTQERLMFSHLMPWRKGTKKNTFDIFPRKGEVWALFKNWDIEWSSCVDNDRHYEFEIVEVVSDFTEGGDMVTVIRLVRIQGFVSLFAQATDQRSSPLKIQMKDMLQFSHKIPSYRLKGNEREGIPKGSLELDTTSLPLNFAEMFPSVRLEDLNNVCNGLYSKSAGKEEVPPCTTNKSSSELHGIPVEELQRSSCQGNGTCEVLNRSSTTKHAAGGSQNQVQSEQATCKQQVGAKDNTDARDPNTNKAAKCHNDSQSSSNPNWYEYPDSEFYNFEEERSTDRFVEGQIWAIYSDVNKNPNYYGWISSVEKERFRVHVTWLEGYTNEEREKGWYKRQLPIGCGFFKTTQEGCVLDSTDTFSHIVKAIPTSMNNYVIYPHVGEIWAVYKNWSLEWSLSDLEGCEYDLVEIIHVTSSGFKALMLSKVNGYRAVFMSEIIGGIPKTIDISFAERCKFSHKIPAFKLREEKGGKLRGYWELDPASVPEVMLSTDSD